MEKKLIKGLYHDIVIRGIKRKKGVFADEAIASGTAIMLFNGPRLDYDEIDPGSYIDEHTLQIGPRTYLGPSGNADDFINHSCDPNTGIHEENGAFVLHAIKDIRAGEEITWDYSTYGEEQGWEMKCECGSSKCRKMVRSFHLLPASVQREYIKKGIVAPFILQNNNVH